MDQLAIENFRNYLRIKTVHPNPDYEGCVEFLVKMADEIGLEHKIIEVSHQRLGLICHLCASLRLEFP